MQSMPKTWFLYEISQLLAACEVLHVTHSLVEIPVIPPNIPVFMEGIVPVGLPNP